MGLHLKLNRINICNLVFLSTFQLFLKYISFIFSFFQHIYRRSARILFHCGPCGGEAKTFHNRCHLRTHILSHLEVDGINSVSIGGPECLDVVPLSESELNIGFIDDTYSEELEAIYQDYVLQVCSYKS